MRSLEDTYIYLVIHFKAQALMQKKTKQTKPIWSNVRAALLVRNTSCTLNGYLNILKKVEQTARSTQIVTELQLSHEVRSGTIGD